VRMRNSVCSRSYVRNVVYSARCVRFQGWTTE